MMTLLHSRSFKRKLSFLFSFLFFCHCELGEGFLTHSSNFESRNRIKTMRQLSLDSLSSKRNSAESDFYTKPSSLQNVDVGKTSTLSQQFSLFKSSGNNDKQASSTTVVNTESKNLGATISFSNIFSNIKNVIKSEMKSDDNVNTEDKFVPTYAEELCSPLGVLVSGWKEEELEIIDDVIFTVMNDPEYQHHQDLSNLKMVSPTTDVLVPMIVLAKSDAKQPLKDLLKTDVLYSRDHELPEDKKEMDVTVPIVLFSGFTSNQIHQCIKGIRLLLHDLDCKNHPDGCKEIVERSEKDMERINSERKEVAERKILFSMAVKNAMEKSIQVLYQEIISDYYENI